jgi:hypothetical protein
MKFEHGAQRTYASLRIRGDSLDPDQVTRMIRVFSTISYAKGTKYFAGEQTGRLIGRTGVWLFSTKDLVASKNLSHHLLFIVGILVPHPKDFGPLTHLHALLAKQKDLRADVACFWHGRFGEKRPSIPRAITEFLKLIPAELEVDFETDSEEAELREA